MHNIIVKEMKRKYEIENDIKRKRNKLYDINDTLLLSRENYSIIFKEYAISKDKDLYLENIKDDLVKKFKRYIENEFVNINRYSFINGINVLSYEQLLKLNEDEQLQYLGVEDGILYQEEWNYYDNFKYVLPKNLKEEEEKYELSLVDEYGQLAILMLKYFKQKFINGDLERRYN